VHFSLIEFATAALRLCVWLALLTALFMPLERWFGQRHEGSSPELRHNLAYYFISSLVPVVFLTLPMAPVETGLGNHKCERQARRQRQSGNGLDET